VLATRTPSAALQTIESAAGSEIGPNLWLRVENNNKQIRGKTKVRDEIEQWVLSRYQMTKDRPDGWEYELSSPYQTDEELDAIIY
jgi:hypothetical protein